MPWRLRLLLLPRCINRLRHQVLRQPWQVTLLACIRSRLRKLLVKWATLATLVVRPGLHRHLPTRPLCQEAPHRALPTQGKRRLGLQAAQQLPMLLQLMPQ